MPPGKAAARVGAVATSYRKKVKRPGPGVSEPPAKPAAPERTGHAGFKLVAPWPPGGDQPKAIAELTEGLLRGDEAQVLLGITGSGKTFSVANVIANVDRPTLIIAHNKIL